MCEHGVLHLLCQDIHFVWDSQGQQSFDIMKHVLSYAPLITPFDFNKGFILFISDSPFTTTRVQVQQGKDGYEHVIYYISKNLSRLQPIFNHDDKLASIVFYSMKKLHYYILLHKNKVLANLNSM